MKKVLLVTDGLFHPPLSARQVLHKSMAELDGYEFQHLRSMEKLPANLKEFSGLVIYIHHQKISDAALSALDDFVTNGGGILGVHTATAAFKKRRRYFEIIGGRFIGHGPIAPFEVIPVSGTMIFAGIPSFTVRDELYIHEFQPGITPHFTATHQGQKVPVVWTYYHGQGRVCYAVPGHTAATMKDKTYQQILQRGLTWVCAE